MFLDAKSDGQPDYDPGLLGLPDGTVFSGFRLLERNSTSGHQAQGLNHAPEADRGDNCNMLFNLGQFDSDLDGTGDSCDPTPFGSIAQNSAVFNFDGNPAGTIAFSSTSSGSPSIQIDFGPGTQIDVNGDGMEDDYPISLSVRELPVTDPSAEPGIVETDANGNPVQSLLALDIVASTPSGKITFLQPVTVMLNIAEAPTRRAFYFSDNADFAPWTRLVDHVSGTQITGNQTIAHDLGALGGGFWRVRFLTGTAAGTAQTISSGGNGAATLDLAAALPSAPAVGDQFVIEQALHASANFTVTGAGEGNGGIAGLTPDSFAAIQQPRAATSTRTQSISSQRANTRTSWCLAARASMPPTSIRRAPPLLC